jgi:hypothetical protein
LALNARKAEVLCRYLDHCLRQDPSRILKVMSLQSAHDRASGACKEFPADAEIRHVVSVAFAFSPCKKNPCSGVMARNYPSATGGSASSAPLLPALS